MSESVIEGICDVFLWPFGESVSEAGPYEVIDDVGVVSQIRDLLCHVRWKRDGVGGFVVDLV